MEGGRVAHHRILLSTERAQSFRVNDNLPSALTGFGGTGVPLDLGYLSTWNTGIYFNFNDSPGLFFSSDGTLQTVDTSFQQWAYDPSNAELTNGSSQGQLYNTAPAGGVGPSPAGVGTGTSEPSNQWYAYPNYSMERIVAEANSTPPFPEFTGGEAAAYEYMSSAFLVPQTESCTYEGTQYDGIRCEYINLNASATLGICASTSLDWYTQPSANPNTFQGTTISATDWTTVTKQLYQECQYATDVQTMFSNYNQIINFVFTGSSTAISQLAIDAGVSDSQSLNVVPTDIVEGILYTALNLTGNVDLGALANLMETGVNSAVAADSNSSLTKPLATTVGTLYSDLGAQFLALENQTSNGETTILEDWGRLSQIGPMTESTGYNGLAITASQVSSIEAQALQGYKLSVMQQLMPVSLYTMQLVVGYAAGTQRPPSTWDYYSYPTFGTNTQENNLFWELDSSNNTYPTQTVMQTDIAGNGANLFDFFNGLNGWASLPVNAEVSAVTTDVTQAGVLNCNTVVTTLFNATPGDLWVQVTPETGTLISPGNAAPGSGDSGNFELRPYGYLPIFTFASGSGVAGDSMNVTMAIFSSSSDDNELLTYTLVSDGCEGKELSDSNYKHVEGYTLQFVQNTPTKSNLQGMWAVVQNSGN